MAVELAPLHGKQHVILPGIAVDGLHFRSQRRVQQASEEGGRRVGAGDADRDLACLEFRDRIHRYRVPDEYHGGLRTRRAQPVELDGVVARFLGAEQRFERRVVLNEPNHAAVLVGVVVEKIGGGHSAGARHVADDENRMARHVPAHIARERARQRVVAAACARAHHDRHRPAFVKVGDGVGLCLRRTGAD